MQSIKNWLFPVGISRDWIWKVIFFPFFATRVCWILLAYFVSSNFLPNPTYVKYFDRGYFLTRIFPIDIFVRWDSAGYFSIIKNGYQPSSDIKTVYSNIPFFPLYPYLVKSIGWLGFSVPDGFYIAFGIFLSNILFLAAIIILYQIIILELGFSGPTAKRSIGLIFAFPTSFIFSCFYTESLFLFLSVASFYFAFKENWKWTAFLSAFLLLTRTQGVIVWAALLMLFIEKNKFRSKNIFVNFLWFIIAPVGLILHLLYLYQKTGYLFAPLVAMSAWGRNNSGILTNLQENLNGPGLDVFKIDLILTIIFIISSLIILIGWKYKSLGFLALILSVLPVSSGLLVSISRYLLPVFPVFIFFGKKLENQEIYSFVLILFYSFQILFFAGWVNYYWIA